MSHSRRKQTNWYFEASNSEYGRSKKFKDDFQKGGVTGKCDRLAERYIIFFLKAKINSKIASSGTVVPRSVNKRTSRHQPFLKCKY